MKKPSDTVYSPMRATFLAPTRTTMTVKFTFILSCVLLLFSCADRNFSDDSRLAGGIIKGESVGSDDPLANKLVMVALNYEYRDGEPFFFGLCTGVIVDSRTILTAAHCLESGIDKVTVLTSVNPREQLRKKKDVYKPLRYKIHEKYLKKDRLDALLKTLKRNEEKSRTLTRNPDLALIYLDRDLEDVTATTDFSSILDIDKSAESTAAIITGYGKTTDLKDVSNIKYEDLNGVLKQATVAVPTDQLYRSGFYLEQWQAPGICHGDSGGPVFIKDKSGELKVAALAINVYEINDRKEKNLDPEGKYNACASHGLYMNIEPYKEWITKTTEGFKD